MSKQISVRRTGLVVFSARIGSIFTGLTFLLLMTRTLSTQQFGLWEVILDVVTFASYPAGLLVYWATRDIARGLMRGKTALGINLALSLLGILLYVVISLLTARNIDASWMTFLLAVLLVPIAYWSQAANAIVNGYNPIVGGYAVITSEAAKLIVAFPLLLVYHAGIDGVIFAIIAANFAQAASSTFLTRESLQLPFDLEAGRKWMTRSWLASLNWIPYVVGIADTFVASIASGGTNLVGYYQAAFSVATIAGYSGYLAAALYPLLLRGGRSSDELPSLTLDLLLLFGVPLAVGAAVLARPILYLLKPAYTDGSTALMILAFAALVTAVGNTFDQTLMGKVTVDADESAGFRHLLHSDLFFVFLVDISATVSYVASVYVIVLLGARSQPIAATLDTWAVAQLAIFAFFAAIRVPRIRMRTRLALKSSFAWYVAGSLIMAVFFAVTSDTVLDYGSRSYQFGAELAVIGLVGIGIYFGFLYATDATFRALSKRLLRRLRADQGPESTDLPGPGGGGGVVPP